MNPAMMRISASFMPRVVMAGVPRRIPLGSMAPRGSSGIMFLLRVIPALSSAAWASFPVRPFVVMSMRSK